RHLSPSSGDVSRTVFLFCQIYPATIRVIARGQKMSSHLPSCAHGLFFDVSMRIQSCKEVFDAKFSNSHHKGLIPIVSTSKITVFKSLGHSELRQLFSVTKYPKFSFTS